jgi:hypothetical protein
MRYPPLMQRAVWLPLALPFTFALACLSCSSDPTPAPVGTSGAGGAPASVMKTVGPEGEVIEVEGAKVTIPKGALASSVAITITASSDPAPAGFVALSRIFKCEPSGTDFAEPVTMQMPFTDDGKPKTMFWTSGGNPSFNDVGGTAVG